MSIELTEWEAFESTVRAFSLEPRDCGNGHWQITGHRLVNCWPNARRGFVMQAANGKSRVGSVHKAIELATELHPKRQPRKTETKYPASVPEVAPWEDRPVGLIRRSWRRFWRWVW